MVDDGACSHKIDYIRNFWILNPEGLQNCINGSKVMVWKIDEFCLLAKLHLEGSAPAEQAELCLGVEIAKLMISIPYG